MVPGTAIMIGQNILEIGQSTLTDVMNGRVRMTLIDGDRLADRMHTKLCDSLFCTECSMLLEDEGCKVEMWLDEAPGIKTKEIKYFDEEEKVWKIGSVIADE